MEKFHILLVRFSSLGDVVLTTSMPSFLKQRWGDKIWISYLTSPAFAPLLEEHKDIDQVHTFPREKGWKGLTHLKKKVEEIDQNRRIDLILDLHGTLRSLFIRMAFWKIPRLSVDKRTFERWILTGLKLDLLSWQGSSYDRRVSRKELQRVSEKSSEKKKGSKFGELLLHRTLRDLAGIFDAPFEVSALSRYVLQGALQAGPGNQNQVSSCSLTYREGNLDEKKWNLPSLEQGKYICLIPSASFPEKRWPVHKFKKLLELALENEIFAGIKFILLAGPEDHFCSQFNDIVQRFPGRFFNLQGQTNILESTQFLKKGLFCVGNDTGLPHLSEAVGTPAIFILGPTGEEFGFYPHLRSSRMVSVSLWCRPCTTNGRGNCIRSERFCLNLITEEMVLAEMIGLTKELGIGN